MNQDIQVIWQEIIADISTAAALWQLAIIAAAAILAWTINGALRAYVMQSAPETWKLGIGGINRVLFPLSMLIFVQLGKVVLEFWEHTSILLLGSKLLLAMAVIRLVVYAVRYIVAPGGLLKSLENSIASFIWLLLALHLGGLLPELLTTMENVKFKIGLNQFNLLQAFQGLITIVTAMLIALWISRVIENKLMRAQNVNMNLRVVLAKLLRIILLAVAILVGLSAVGLDITLLSVFGGALGVGLGFGLQRIASNYVSGFILLLDKSMQIGDVITVDNHYGVVRELRTRYLLLRKLDGTEVIIPNETLIINPVINHSFSEHKARVQLTVQVSYDSPLDQAMQLIAEIAKRHSRTLEDPMPAVLVKGFGDSGIDLMLTVWIPDPEEGSAALQSEIYLEIWRAFQANKIVIPFPQREIRIIGNLPVTVSASVSSPVPA